MNYAIKADYVTEMGIEKPVFISPDETNPDAHNWGYLLELAIRFPNRRIAQTYIDKNIGNSTLVRNIRTFRL